MNSMEQGTTVDMSEMSLPKKIGYAVCGGWVAIGVGLAAAEFISQTVEYADNLAKLVH